MRGSVVRKNSQIFLGIVVALFSAVLTNATAFAQESSVNAIICGAGSSVTINEPASDSVVTEPLVTVKGTTDQASQIVIEVDGEYDGVVPLTVAQTSFEAPVQLSSGTHTIKLTAIDSCGAANSDASTVVTFTPPPSLSSDGSTIATGINSGEKPGGVTITNADGSPVEQKSEGGILPAPVANAVYSALQWLNITPGDSSGQSVGPKLSVVRAVTIALGAYTATIGLAAGIVTNVASTPLFYRFELKSRYLIASRTLRVAGLLLVLGGFLF